MMLIACLLSGFFSFIGLELSYDFNWPPGATIALTAAATYATLLLVKGKFFLLRKT
jgi:ABC-type Mn2+/Zn2+ transport system permease subunit